MIDKEAIQKYIELYAGDHHNPNPANINIILEPWFKAKNDYLFQLFGGTEILEREVELEQPEYEINTALRSLINNSHFIATVRARIYSNHAYEYTDAFDINTLRNNKTSCQIIIEKTKFPTGTKPMKILKKIQEVEELSEDDFEEFRLEHSRILNQKKLKGTLCLSIHPLDYMTMSDNTYGWSSCMSWQEDGGYRSGTIEMMNSPCAVVAYLRGSEDMHFDKYTWNNKKWRSLFVVTPNIITSVKGYPYQNEELAATSLMWLTELAQTNLKWDLVNCIIRYEHYKEFIAPNHSIVSFRFQTNDWMYNDFGTASHYATVNNLIKDGLYNINYGSTATCMCCGETLYVEDESCLYCSDCYPMTCCYECGEEIERDEDYCYDGCYYCPNCYDNLFCEDALTGDIESREDCVVIELKDPETGTVLDDFATWWKGWYYRNNTWKQYFTIDEPRSEENEFGFKYYYVYKSDCTPMGLRKLFGR